MSDVKPLEIDFEPTVKQDLIFEAFDDTLTTEILYGGSAGSAKSYGICALIILKALQFPGIRIGLGRNELTTLKKTTVISFFEVASDWGLQPGEHFNYNSTSGIIKFFNDSEIVLVELNYKPSDPNYTRLGGLLFTFGVVDEVGEVDQRGYQIFKTRLGRWRNDEFSIKPICISTCNPIKNWLYREFYLPHVEQRLKEYQMFIQALPTDNPYISQDYISNLEKLPTQERERLLHGNWEYENNPNDLITYDEILNIWSNVPPFKPKEDKPKRYISADIAFTSDRTVIIIWEEYTIVDIVINPEGNLEDVISQLATKWNVPQYNICFDSDGVGKFLTTRLRNAKPIVNNAQAFKNENYKNLKTQLYYKLAEKISGNEIKSMVKDHQDLIIEELQTIRHKPTSKVGKLEMIDKAEVKKILGRSPDFADAMAYRMYFEYKQMGSRKTFKIG